MLNKRAAKLLALVLAGSMMLSGPSAALASTSSGDSKETSQTETKEKKSESADSAKDKDPKKKKAKKQASGNSISSAKGKVAEESDEKDLQKASASANGPQGDEDPTLTATPSISPTVSATAIPSVSPTVSATATPSTIPTDSPMITPTDIPDPQNELKLYEFNGGNTYPSGTTIQFYATGAGYVPDEEKDPVNDATRYKPVSWNVSAISGGSSISSGSWTKYSKKVSGNDGSVEYQFEGSFVINTDQTTSVSYNLSVDYQKEIYKGGKWETDGVPVSKSVSFSITNGLNTATPTVPVTSAPTVLPTVKPSIFPTAIPTNRPTIMPTDIPDQEADPTRNGLYWINEGATYRSGASLQFYATGDGYGPDEVQETDPVAGATRYIPISWSVVATNGGATGASGTWTKSNREVTRGGLSGNTYASGEYRFKGSFVLSTNLTTSVPYTLQVNYQKEVYGGRRWKTDNTTPDTKRVNFYIRNTALTVTPSFTPRPTSSYYNQSGVTSTAARSSISSNAQNASTEDNTPIGALMLLMMAAAGSGLMIFRKKQTRS